MHFSPSDMGIDVASSFETIIRNESNLATAIAAQRILILVLEKCSARTLQELVKLLKQASDQMKNVDCSVSSVVSGCELFLRFITLASKLEEGTFEEIRSVMLTKGRHFLEKMMMARSKIARLGANNISDGSKVLVHSRSRTVVATLKEAHRLNKRFEVFVTKSSFEQTSLTLCGKLNRQNDLLSRNDMMGELVTCGIPCTVILDSAVGYIMEQVDCVMVGAEGVVESGGIINKIGTCTIALCAKMLNKPVYVMCESFKFVRLYPLNQQDLPDEFKYHASTIASSKDLSMGIL